MLIQMIFIQNLIDKWLAGLIIIMVGGKLRRDGEKIGKKRIRDQARKEINQWEGEMANNKIKITRCESGDWEILEYAGYRDSNHHINYINFFKTSRI